MRRSSIALAPLRARAPGALPSGLDGDPRVGVRPSGDPRSGVRAGVVRPPPSPTDDLAPRLAEPEPIERSDSEEPAAASSSAAGVDPGVGGPSAIGDMAPGADAEEPAACRGGSFASGTGEATPSPHPAVPRAPGAACGGEGMLRSPDSTGNFAPAPAVEPPGPETPASRASASSSLSAWWNAGLLWAEHRRHERASVSRSTLPRDPTVDSAIFRAGASGDSLEGSHQRLPSSVLRARRSAGTHGSADCIDCLMAACTCSSGLQPVGRSSNKSPAKEWVQAGAATGPAMRCQASSPTGAHAAAVFTPRMAIVANTACFVARSSSNVFATADAQLSVAIPSGLLASSAPSTDSDTP